VNGDLRLALLLVRGAGRRDAVRFVSMTLGVAVALMAILVGLAAPRVSSAAHGVEAARTPRLTSAQPGQPGPALRVSTSNETFGDRPWTQVSVSGVDVGSPLPPGLPRWPRAGHTVVSPALAEVLRGHADLGLGLGSIDTTRVGEAGLTAPDELYSYTVHTSGAVAPGTPIVGFGVDVPVSAQGSPTRTLLIETFLLVGVPALVFLSVCLRLSTASRSSRAFSLSLAGMSPSRSARLYSTEMSLTAATGGALGLLAYAFVEGPLGTSGLLGIRWWPRQAGLSWPTALVCLGITIWLVRRVAYRVMSRSATRTRSERAETRSGRLAVAGVVLAAPGLVVLLDLNVQGLRHPSEEWASSRYAAIVTGSIAVALVGIVVGAPAVISWLGARVAPRCRRGVQLGIRASVARAATTGKLVAFVSIVVMLGGLCAAFLSALQRTSFGDPASAPVSFDLGDLTRAERAQIATAATYPYTIDGAIQSGTNSLAVQIGDCSGVERSAVVVFKTPGPCEPSVQRGNGGIGGGAVTTVTIAGRTISIPPSAVTPHVTWDLKFPIRDAPWVKDLHTGTVTYWVSKKDDSYAKTLAILRRRFPRAHLDAGLKDPERFAVFTQQQGLIHAALAVGLALSVGAFLLAALEIRWARARSVSTLAALGVSRRVLRTSNSVQFAFPVLVGGLLASAVGTLGGWAYLSFYGTEGMFAAAVLRWTVVSFAIAVFASAVVGWVSGAGTFDREVMSDV
jgi:hypothetical protein